MHVIVTARNCEVSTEVRDAIDARFDHLQRFEARASRVEVVFTGEKNRVRAEAVVSIDRGERIHGEGEGPDARSAFDKLAQKLGVQLRRNHERHHAHRAPPMDELFGDPNVAPGEVEESE